MRFIPAKFLKTPSCMLAICLSFATSLAAQKPQAFEGAAAIEKSDNAWILKNDVLEVSVRFEEGNIVLSQLHNRVAKADYLPKSSKIPLFGYLVNGQAIAANDGGWRLAGAKIGNIDVFGKNWGKSLEIILSRSNPLKFSVRLIFEIYNGRSAIRYYSFVKNEGDTKTEIAESDVLALDLPDRPHKLYYIAGMLQWKVSDEGLTHGGRNAIVRYDSGDGWFAVPENNWATSMAFGRSKADRNEKFLHLNVWNSGPGVRVATNPKAVRLVLFPHEEIEYFSVNLGVFQGDDWDGRMAVAEHLRKRFRFIDPTPTLSTNDWQWGVRRGKRSDANYRNIAIPKAAAAGFDRFHIDAEWYTEDGCDTANHWTDMVSLGEFLTSRGMKPGHWFPLQGRGGSAELCWAAGRDCADPTNIDFKLKQTEEILIPKYRSAWGQLDCGLLWKNEDETSFSHASDSVYRKLLGMRRYINTITRKYPEYLMHVTCEIDNCGSNWRRGDQNVGLVHLGDNAIIGMFHRTETTDDVRDIFSSIGMFPTEGLLSTFGENVTKRISWADSPLWYYQFLLARHSSVYSWPGDWSEASVAHLRIFNDWRKNPRIKSLLGEILRPVFNGTDRFKNEGPWAWMFVNAAKSQALLIALNHLELSKENTFDAKLRWLAPDKTYLVEDITLRPGGSFHYAFRGEYTGADLISSGLKIDLTAGPERCAAYWICEKTSNQPQLLYADSAVTAYAETAAESGVTVELQGVTNAAAQVIVYKPAQKAVECRTIRLDAAGRAKAVFDAKTVTEEDQPEKS